MVERILRRFLLLILILICILITPSYSKSISCETFNRFSCSIKELKCFYAIDGEKELDCVPLEPLKIDVGVYFNLTLKSRSGEIVYCDTCCCPSVNLKLDYYQNSCSTCVTLWLESLENETLIFSGNETIMGEAVNNKELLKLIEKNDLPESVILCPDAKKRRCKLDSHMDGNWTIVSAANPRWSEYFEKRIPHGFITVKKPGDFIHIELAIMQKDINVTRIHFLKVSVEEKSKNDSTCIPCSEEPTTLPLSTSPKPSTQPTTSPLPTSPKRSTQMQPMNDASTNAVHSRSKSTSQATTFPAWSTSSLPFTELSKNIISSDEVLLKNKDKDNLEQQLNSTGNKADKRLKVLTNFLREHHPLSGDNLAAATTELSKSKNISENNTKNFAEAVDIMSSPTNWENLPPKKVQPSDILNATDNYFGKASKHMKKGEETKRIKKRNIIMHYGNVPRQQPSILYSYEVSTMTIVKIPPQVLQTETSARIRYSFVLYKTLAVVMKKIATSWNEKESQSERLNSPILSITIYPQLRTPLKKNINFTLNHNKRSSSRLSCAYWNFSYKSRATGLYGRWETDGCHVVSQNQSCTTCSCNHLTNFALLMSIHKVKNNHITKVISLISGSISSLSVIITIACYAVIWPNITQNPVNRSRAIILMNLCVALLTANLIFLVGSHQYKNKIACKAISILLHFFYLAVFFSMLMEGIDMFITVILVFSKKIKVKWFILGTWIFPLLIVAISLLVKFDNYVDLDNCWISVHGGLRLAFIGPAFFIIFINTIILIIVISRMLRTREMMQKTVQERVRTGARGIALLSPVLGFTWITGFFLLDDHEILQYIFIASHSLQGIFIFLLHCLFSRQVREGFCQWLHKKSYFNELSNSTMKCAVMDQTNVTRTMSTAQSLDELDSYQNKLSEFQPRKSVDFLIPGK